MNTWSGSFKLPIFLLVALLIIIPVSAEFAPEITADDVHYNITSHIDDGTTTPFDIWFIAAALGVILFFLSLTTPKTTAEVERDTLVSIFAWVPIGFTAYTSFAVDRITSAGVTTTANSGIVLLENHVIYSFGVIGILFAIFLILAIINTFRIIAVHKALRLQQENISPTRATEYM